MEVGSSTCLRALIVPLRMTKEPIICVPVCVTVHVRMYVCARARARAYAVVCMRAYV
jgi:hypothetical protein